MKKAAAPAPGGQKSIASFFSKAPAKPQEAKQGERKEDKDEKKTNPPPPSAQGKAYAPTPPEESDDMMILEEGTPSSEVKKRKQPSPPGDTPSDGDKRARFGEEGDDDEDSVSMRKSTRRRVVPVNMAESSDDDDDGSDQDDAETARTVVQSKAKQAPQSGVAPAAAPTASSRKETAKAKVVAGSAIKFGSGGGSKVASGGGSGSGMASGGVAGGGGKMTEKERAKVHERFANKVNLIQTVASDRGDRAAADTGVGGVLQTCKLVPPRGAKLTPFEDQVVQIKNKNPDLVLLTECGYKFKFMGRDAEIASRVLNIFHHMDHSFFVASIPTQRVDVHTRRLVEAGYKVGIVRQTENAALKAVSDTKNKGFNRELCEVYTKSTMLVEDVHVLEGSATIAAQSGAVYMLCVCEKGGVDGAVEVGIVAVDSGSGDIVYDQFQDDTLRTGVETRVSHLQPKEILMPDNLSRETSKIIKRMAQGLGARLETVPARNLDEEASRNKVRELFAGNDSRQGVTEEMGEEEVGCVAEGRVEEQGMEGVLRLPPLVVCGIGGMIVYLKTFGLQHVLRLTGNMWRFSSRSHMLLDAQVLANLEVMNSEATGGETYSLVWLLKATKTAFGARLLKHWIAHPLLSKQRIEDRHDAVEELTDSPAAAEPIAALLKGLPDLERAVARIHYGKCAPNELLALLQALNKVSSVAKEAAEMASSLQSSLLRSLIGDMPDLSNVISAFLDEINHKAAQEAKGTGYDKKQLLAGFNSTGEYPQILELKDKVKEVDEEMRGHLYEVRRMVRIPDLEYKSVLTTHHLIEIPNSKIAMVPKDWTKINGTKTHARFHTPTVLDLVQKKLRLEAKLDILCDDAWKGFLGRVAQSYGDFKNVVQRLAVLDCLFSLAAVAKRGGWVRPQMKDEQVLRIVQGRHPMVDAKMGSGFVPNDISLDTANEAAMVITGPNMGGKSSYIRQNALLVIMAQVGSFVPAESAELGIFDAVYTRMGASDSISTGRSTFLIETHEAADIMRKATSKSLVVMDELGRGTSTHDGTAIAYATLRELVDGIRCFCLFVTHYQPLCQMQHELNGKVGNYHMSFMEEGEGEHRISFMYRLVRGRADRSFGLNVASLANLPIHLVNQAKLLSKEMESSVDERLRRRMAQVFQRSFALAGEGSVDKQALQALCGEARALVSLGKLE